MGRVLNLVLTIFLAIGLLGPVRFAGATSPPDLGVAHMPPDPTKIGNALQQQGLVSPDASPEQLSAAVRQYLAQKLTPAMARDEGNPIAREKLRSRDDDRNDDSKAGDTVATRGDQTQKIAPSLPRWPAGQPTADKLLVFLFDFSEAPFTWTPQGGVPRTAAGPRHNQIPQPKNDFDLWVPNFDQAHYQQMLFGQGGWTFPTVAGKDYPYEGQKRGSLRDYFLTQSYGKYALRGDVFGWITVDKPEAYYGDDSPAGGLDNLLPGTPRDLVQDAVGAVNRANPGFNWASYDLDNDGIVDHPLFVHAGTDQSGGGGLQGNDAIWARSSSAKIKVGHLDGHGPFDGDIFIANYTIMPEDGGVGVFAHEFGHDLGLPDEYDTIFSGIGESVGFWSLMASGSWVGKPAQTQPAGLSAWSKYYIGWLNPKVVKIDNLDDDPLKVVMDQAEVPGSYGVSALRISLPLKQVFVNKPFGGTWEWFGGKADNLDTTLRRSVDLRGKNDALLSFAAWYDTEEGWDFAFVQVSTDRGTTWRSLPVSGTTSECDPTAKPEIAANLPGFTGNSGGWKSKSVDLSTYAGQQVLLQFRNMTDLTVNMSGFYVDDIKVTTGGNVLFFDNAEKVDPAWVANGWARNQGFSMKAHYYLLEWRNLDLKAADYRGQSLINFDLGLKQAYSFDPSVSDAQPGYFDHDSGLLVWYRDTAYTDNWVGLHPGHGFLGLVDAHSNPDITPKYGLPWDTRVQLRDAAFGLARTTRDILSYFGKSKEYSSLPAVSSFDDSRSYWSPKAPDNSMIVPKYGLSFKVGGVAPDSSAVLLYISRKS